MYVKSLKEKIKGWYLEKSPLTFFGPVYKFVYDKDRDILILQDNAGFLLPKYHVAEIIEDLKKYVDEFPQELIDEVNAYAEKNNTPC
jgi:hypothetical protein